MDFRATFCCLCVCAEQTAALIPAFPRALSLNPDPRRGQEANCQGLPDTDSDVIRHAGRPEIEVLARSRARACLRVPSRALIPVGVKAFESE